MNWDSNAPLELLSSMPAQLNKKNLKDIQAIIDKDKFACSRELTRDLCGEYAPFCALCDKSLKYPCAVSYVKMKQADGMQVEIAVSDDDNSDIEDEHVEVATAAAVATEVVADNLPAETPVAEQKAAVEEVPAKETPVEEAPVEVEPVETVAEFHEEQVEAKEEVVAEQPVAKKRIRIAIAKRKVQ